MTDIADRNQICKTIKEIKCGDDVAKLTTSWLRKETSEQLAATDTDLMIGVSLYNRSLAWIRHWFHLREVC